MKFKNTFALITLLLHTTALWGMDNEHQEKILKIKKSIEHINSNIKVDENTKKVIIIGPTGTGKSVLLNYLAEKPLTGKKGTKGKKLILEVNDPLEGSVIGYGKESGTTLPFSWKDSNSVEYWDCPGFGATSGTEQEIIDAFAIHHLCKGPTKIVLAISEGGFEEERAQIVLKFFEKMTTTFPQSPMGKKFEGFSFIVTKNRDVDINEELKELLENSQNSTVVQLQDPRVKDLIKYLNTEQVFAPFPCPEKEGSYPIEHRIKILDVINQTQFVTRSDVRPAVSSDMRLLAQDLAKELNKDIETSLNKDVAERLMHCCLRKVDLYSNPLKNKKELESFLEKFKENLNELTKEGENNFFIQLNEFFSKRRTGEENFELEKDKETLAKIQNNFESIKFLQKIDSGVSFNMNSCIVAFYPTLNRVNTFLYDPKQFYEAAAIEKFPNAYKALGIIYESGCFGEKNILKAIDEYKKAANEGFTPIQYRLGCFYSDDVTVEKNDKEAFLWFEKAAQNNHAVSQYNLGLMYERGIGVTKNTIKAFEYFEKAANQNILEAFISLGLLCRSQENKQGEFLQWFEKSANLGDEKSQHIIGRHNKIEAKHEIAFKWFEKSAHKNLLLSQYEVALSYLEGKGTKKDAKKAIKLLKMLANQEDDTINIPASLKLGNMYLNGEEVKKSESEAKKWFKKAAEKGHKGAIKMVKYLKK